MLLVFFFYYYYDLPSVETQNVIVHGNQSNIEGDMIHHSGHQTIVHGDQIIIQGSHPSNNVPSDQAARAVEHKSQSITGKL